MNKWQRDVYAFHQETALDIGGFPPEIRRPELRANLIMEEAAETAEALTGQPVSYIIGEYDDESGGGSIGARLGDVEDVPEQNMLDAIDGMVDTIVVVLGTAIEMGIDLDPFWDEVQRANMSKAGGPKRDDGKQLKPEGWVPPDHGAVLLRTYGLAT